MFRFSVCACRLGDDGKLVARVGHLRIERQGPQVAFPSVVITAVLLGVERRDEGLTRVIRGRGALRGPGNQHPCGRNPDRRKGYGQDKEAPSVLQQCWHQPEYMPSVVAPQMPVD